MIRPFFSRFFPSGHDSRDGVTLPLKKRLVPVESDQDSVPMERCTACVLFARIWRTHYLPEFWILRPSFFLCNKKKSILLTRNQEDPEIADCVPPDSVSASIITWQVFDFIRVGNAYAVASGDFHLMHYSISQNFVSIARSRQQTSFPMGKPTLSPSRK
jgi:hypothetical protein